MQCRICGNDQRNQRYVASEMMFGTKEPFDYFQCAACDCLQIDQYPADIAKHYPDGYYSYSKGDANGSLFDRLKYHLRDRYEVSRRGRIGRYYSERSPNSILATLSPVLQDRRQHILDVGCGSGALLRTLRTIGFRRLTGVDPFIDSDIRMDKHFAIYKKELAEVSGQFDLIMFHHSLEHLPHQHEVFRQIAEHLRPGGKCVLRVPLSSSFAWQHYRTNWVQLDAPRHFYLHSVKSLERLASNVGMRLDRTVFDSDRFQFWGSEQYERGIPLRDPRSLAECKVADSIFTREQMGEFRKRAAELNANGQGDQAALFFSKLKP
jgi:SAM-dependent methyltransferase